MNYTKYCSLQDETVDTISLKDSTSLSKLLLRIVSQEMPECELIVGYDSVFSSVQVLQDLLLLPNIRKVRFCSYNPFRKLIYGYFWMFIFISQCEFLFLYFITHETGKRMNSDSLPPTQKGGVKTAQEQWQLQGIHSHHLIARFSILQWCDGTVTNA